MIMESFVSTKSTPSNLPMFVLALGIVCLLLYLRRRRGPQSILLLGCSNSGKSVLLTTLIYYDKPSDTFTSIRENIGFYTTKKRRVKLVDIPGHELLRQSVIDVYKENMCGIIFVIDSNTIQSEIRDVAELLYGVLTDPVISTNCHQILFVCNKQDLPEAKGPAVIQMLLEKELNILEGLRIKQLDSTSDEAVRRTNTSLRNRMDFEFSHLKSMNVTFAESNILPDGKSDRNVKEIVNWLSER